MATYSIENEGNPIVPINLSISFPVNARVTLVEEINSNKSGQEFTDQITAYAQNAENSYKNHPFFSTKDENRNVGTLPGLPITPESLGPHQEEGYFIYRLTMPFTIENAVVTESKFVQTDLTGQEKADFLQTEADTFEADFKAGHNWVDL